MDKSKYVLRKKSYTKAKGHTLENKKLAPSKAFKLYERLHMKKGFGIKGRNKRKKKFYVGIRINKYLETYHKIFEAIYFPRMA